MRSAKNKAFLEIHGDYIRDDVNDIRLCYLGRFYRAADEPI